MGLLRIILLSLAASISLAAAVSFNRDVRPLLAENCFECHGPDKAKGTLRLDNERGARKVIENRELVKRLISNDEEERMPPADSGKKRFNREQVAILDQWISEGAQ